VEVRLRALRICSRPHFVRRRPPLSGIVRRDWLSNWLSKGAKLVRVLAHETRGFACGSVAGQVRSGWPDISAIATCCVSVTTSETASRKPDRNFSLDRTSLLPGDKALARPSPGCTGHDCLPSVQYRPALAGNHESVSARASDYKCAVLHSVGASRPPSST
jgi:hypothetical protein